MLHKIGVISDTHDLLRNEVLQQLDGCEQIFHAGDCSNPQIIEHLEKIAPVTVVQGNNDLTRNREWAKSLPETADFMVHGLHIFMVHNKKFLPENLSVYNLVIYGHSHKYEDKIVGNTRILNPGSCGPRRFHQEITMAIMEIDDGHENKPGRLEETVRTEDSSSTQDTAGRIVSVKKIIIPHTPSISASGSHKHFTSGVGADSKEKQEKTGKGIVDAASEEISLAELKLQIEPMIPSIMKDLAAGKTVKQIACKYKITEELSEQITRMYLTHPGVDADGILRRLGL